MGCQKVVSEYSRICFEKRSLKFELRPSATVTVTVTMNRESHSVTVTLLTLPTGLCPFSSSFILLLFTLLVQDQLEQTSVYTYDELNIHISRA